MLTPTYPRLLTDRDQVNDWYLDEDVLVELSDGHGMFIEKGFRFDSHTVPLFAQLFFARHLPSKKNEPNDIYAAMVHDALIATKHRHRFSRSYMDGEYKRFMNMSEYKMNNMRAWGMPLAVRIYGWWKFDLKGDYRGIPKKNTFIRVTVTHSDTKKQYV